MSSDVVPAGFEPFSAGPGFGESFGELWIDRSGARIGFRVMSRHVNVAGVCHGGAMATFADMQLVAVQFGDDRPHTPTVNLDLAFLAPAPLGSWVEARVTLLRRTTTLLFTQAVMTADGEPVARSSAIYRNRPVTGE